MKKVKTLLLNRAPQIEREPEADARMKKYRHLAFRLGLMHFEDPGLLLLGTPPMIVVEDPGDDKGIKVHVFTADRTNSRLVYQGPAQRGWYQNDVVNYTFELDGWIHELQMA